MPIQLRAVDDPQDPMVISLTDYITGRDNFIKHYFLADCDSDFGGQDLELPWDELQKHVDEFVEAAETTSVALRLVYCYDPDCNELYLRVQLCTMEETADVADIYLLNTDTQAWYRIYNGEMTKTDDIVLYDKPYLDYFYYCDAIECDTSTLDNLANDTDAQMYARNVTFPWFEEIYKMYKANKSPQGASICFGACSYVHPNESSSEVAFPHGLVLYLKNASGRPMLNDKDYIVKFENKGCDCGTLCPPSCNVYVMPKTQ